MADKEHYCENCLFGIYYDGPRCVLNGGYIIEEEPKGCYLRIEWTQSDNLIDVGIDVIKPIIDKFKTDITKAIKEHKKKESK